MRRVLLVGVAFLGLLLFISSCKKSRDVSCIEILHTTDLHGHFFPYDFTTGEKSRESLSAIVAYADSLRTLGDREVLYLDGGDILQGTPVTYYYNFIDTVSPHIVGKVLNHLRYDAFTVGNHDIEAGHPVYDRLRRELDLPILGANVIDVAKSEAIDDEIPYFEPFTLVERQGKRIAVLGLTMPKLTQHLPEVLWEGMRFEDQIEVARNYLPEIMQAEPDLFIALIHSGSGQKEGEYRPMSENVGYHLAEAIPEIDIIFSGHDHRVNMDSIIHTDGKKTYLLNPGNHARAVSHVTLTFTKEENGTEKLHIQPRIVSMMDQAPSSNFISFFKKDIQAVKTFVETPIGEITAPLDARSAFFGPSPFIDLIHQLQLSIFPDSEVSITAPLLEDATLPAGKITMGTLFMLYKYENMLYQMLLNGEEIRGLLEESYDRWIQTVKEPSDPLLRIDKEKLGGQYLPFEHPSFNFDTAHGVTYTVDVTKERGERVHISHISGKPFQPYNIYKVAINSYRGNGGGGLLTKGAGISQEALKGRIVKATDKDLRYYLIDFLKTNNPYTPKITSQWSFIPEELVAPMLLRDSILLFLQS